MNREQGEHLSNKDVALIAAVLIATWVFGNALVIWVANLFGVRGPE